MCTRICNLYYLIDRPFIVSFCVSLKLVFHSVICVWTGSVLSVTFVTDKIDGYNENVYQYLFAYGNIFIQQL